VAAGALALGLIGIAGCGGDEQPARDSVQPMAPPGEKLPPPKAGAANSAPRVDSVRFDPAQPGAGQAVRAIVEASDPDGDRVRLSYAWSVDGETVAAAEGAKLDLGGHAERGARLEVRVTPSDGYAEGDPFVATTTLGNRPPRISNLTIHPAGKITAAGPITAAATGADPDGDAVTYVYTWTVNGETSDEHGSVFPDTELKRGDVVTVSVVASDEQDESEPLVGPEIHIENAAPVISSQPDVSSANGAFVYKIAAADPDGDGVHYGLGKAPEGMTVEQDGGTVSWTPRDDQSGVHAVEVWAEDPQGARATQRFELTIDTGVPAAPAPPAAKAPVEEPGEETSAESD
jgi:hypothetical protein